MSIRVAPSSFSSATYPKILVEALTRSQPEPEDVHAAHVFPEDNDWAAGMLMVEFLLRARPRHARLNRSRAAEILRAEGSQVTIEHLEARGFVRFVLGRLQIPEAVRVELAHGKHVDQLPDAERAALKRLHESRQEKTALLHIEKIDAERIHQVHAQAHRRTPSFEALRESRLITLAENESEGYDIPLNKNDSHLWPTYLVGRVLGLYWEEIARDSLLENDDDRLSVWLDVALETHWWTTAPRWMRTSQNRKMDLRERFLDAAMRCILSEPDLLDGCQELKRIRWDNRGFGFNGAPDFPPFPDYNGSLHGLYGWWSSVHLSQVESPCRRRLDALISLTMIYDQDPWAHRAVQLIGASRDRPYLLREVGNILLSIGRRSVAGLVANRETASMGMHILAKLRVAEDLPTQSLEIYRDDKETRKTKVWREAVSLMLGMIHAEIQEGHLEATALVLAEVLLISAKATLERRHQPTEEESHLRGAEARFDVLLTDLRCARWHVLLPLVHELHRHLVVQTENGGPTSDGFDRMPVAGMRNLFWLHAVLSEQEHPPLDPMKVAESLLSIYRDVLRRETTSDGAKILFWLDDAHDAICLPWPDLAAFLHKRDLVHMLVGPEGVDLDVHVSGVPPAFQSGASSIQRDAERDLSQTWLRKIRLHIRVLVRLHEEMQEVASVAMMELTNAQRSSLLELVEERLRALVTAHADTQPPHVARSLFDTDNDLRTSGVHPVAGLLKLLIRTFNNFSGERREGAFAEWIDEENDPIVILTILDEAVPIASKLRAASKLKRVDFDSFLATQWTMTQIQRFAEAAAMVPDQTAVVEKALAYGDSVVLGGYRPKWEDFAYRMRLMVAYHRNDLAELGRISAPKREGGQQANEHGHLTDPSEDSRLFYRALLIIEDEPEQARRIFDDLLQRVPGSPSHAINRFSASVKLAGKIAEPEERSRAFLRASHEWEDVARGIPSGALAVVQNNAIYLRLACFNGTQQDANFDTEWSRLDATQWAQLEFVALAVDNSRRRGLRDRGAKILDRARPYHVEPTGKLADAFARLVRDVDSGKALAEPQALVVSIPGDNIESLRRSHQELRLSRAEYVAQIVGEPGAQLHDFLTELLYEVALELLERIGLTENFSGENQYNDLMVSLLKMRVRFLNWHVPDQARGGHSETGKDAGERDWMIVDGGGPCVIFEAFRLDSVDKKTIEEHVRKAESRHAYNPIGIPRINIVVYYEGRSWLEFWKKYSVHVRSLAVNGCLPTQRPEADRVRHIRMQRLVYEDGSGVALHVCHLAINLSR